MKARTRPVAPASHRSNSDRQFQPRPHSHQSRVGTVAVGYLRRSTDRQEQSIPDQRKAIEAYAEKHRLNILKFYADDAISGTSTIGRRAFQQMIADAQSPSRSFSLIIVYDVKRFGRVDNDEAGYYRHLLRQNGVEVCYVSENFTGDGTDDLLRPVKQWQAREESKDLSKVTIRGLLTKVQSGCWMGGVPPFGYDLRYENADGQLLFILRHMPEGTKLMLNPKGRPVRTLARGESLNISKRDRARLVLSDPVRVEVIRRIFQMYAEERRGFKVIAGTLNKEKVPPARGPAWSSSYHGQWTDSTIRSILTNPVYTGDLVWNRRTDGKFHRIAEGRAIQRHAKPGARLIVNQSPDWITVPNTHPQIISRRLFEQARRIREERPASKRQRNRAQPPIGGWSGSRATFLLSGLLQCERCGNRYQGYTRAKGERRKDGSVVQTRSYACGGYITKGASVCQLNPVDQDDLEQCVIKALISYYGAFQGRKGQAKLLQAARSQLGMESARSASARKQSTAVIRRIDKTIQNLLDNITAINRDLIDQRLIELQQQREREQERLRQLDDANLPPEQVETIVSEAQRFLASLERVFTSGSPDGMRAALRQCVHRIIIDKPSMEFRLELHPVPTLPDGDATHVQTLTLQLPAR